MKFWNTNTFTTYFLNAYSIPLPAGEKFFIDTLKKAAEIQLSSDQQKDIVQFIKEEEAHRRAHTRYNQQLITEGYAIDQLEAPVIKELAHVSTHYSFKEQLALVAALEYITMQLSKIVLRNPHLLSPKKSIQADIWRWHCKEEIEHNHVAVELLKSHKVGYFLRIFYFLLALIIMWQDGFSNVRSFYKTDKRKKEIRLSRFLRDTLSTGWHLKLDILRFAFGCLAYFFPLKAEKIKVLNP